MATLDTMHDTMYDSDWIEAKDPGSRLSLVRFPFRATYDTQGRQQYLRERAAGVPRRGVGDGKGRGLSICVLYHRGKCRSHTRCRQLHVQPKVVDKLRDEAAGDCCEIHSQRGVDRPRLWPAVPAHDVVILEPHGALAAYHMNSRTGVASRFTTDNFEMTKGLFDALAAAAGAAATGTPIYIETPRICQLNRLKRCKWGHKCMNIHLCRVIAGCTDDGDHAGGVAHSNNNNNSVTPPVVNAAALAMGSGAAGDGSGTPATASPPPPAARAGSLGRGAGGAAANANAGALMYAEIYRGKYASSISSEESAALSTALSTEGGGAPTVVSLAASTPPRAHSGGGSGGAGAILHATASAPPLTALMGPRAGGGKVSGGGGATAKAPAHAHTPGKREAAGESPPGKTSTPLLRLATPAASCASDVSHVTPKDIDDCLNLCLASQGVDASGGGRANADADGRDPSRRPLLRMTGGGPVGEGATEGGKHGNRRREDPLDGVEAEGLWRVEFDDGTEGSPPPARGVARQGPAGPRPLPQRPYWHRPLWMPHHPHARGAPPRYAPAAHAHAPYFDPRECSGNGTGPHPATAARWGSGGGGSGGGIAMWHPPAAGLTAPPCAWHGGYWPHPHAGAAGYYGSPTCDEPLSRFAALFDAVGEE